ncbi:hypothetical protein LINGRAHAP2_LOCUS33206 [Linum grandiflorum]
MAAARVVYIMTVPAVAAALGCYLLDRTTSSSPVIHNHHFKSSPLSFDECSKDSGSCRRIPAAAAAGTVEEKNLMPNLAPQFDGLFCFETLICKPNL